MNKLEFALVQLVHLNAQPTDTNYSCTWLNIVLHGQPTTHESRLQRKQTIGSRNTWLPNTILETSIPPQQQFMSSGAQEWMALSNRRGRGSHR